MIQGIFKKRKQNFNTLTDGNIEENNDWMD